MERHRLPRGLARVHLMVASIIGYVNNPYGHREMVIERLNRNKTEAEKALSALREKGDIVDYDTVAVLEETIDTIGQLIAKMPWNRLSQEELEKWYESTQLSG